MKKIVLLPALTLIVFLASCGPAAEDRQAMHSRAKVFQDSIANAIRASIAEAEGPAGSVAPIDTIAAKAAATNSAAPVK